MANNNTNIWSALMNPVADRPGTPIGVRQAVHTTRKVACPTPAAPRRLRKRKSTEHMPEEAVAFAHAKASLEHTDNPWHLSPRMMQILDMLVQGMGPAVIARELELSKSAVSKYTTDIKERMGVDTLPQAVVAWHRHYRVLQPDASVGDKDSTLVANLARATEALRAQRKEPV